MATTVARGSLLVTPSASSTVVVASIVASTVAGGALATSPVTTDGASSASVVVTTASPAWSARSGVIVRASTPTSTRPTVPTATISSRPPRVAGSGGRPRQLGWVAPRTLVRGQRSVRHRIANLLMAAAAVASHDAPRRGRSGTSGGTGGETTPATMPPCSTPRPTDEWLALGDDALPVAGAYEWAVRADCGAVVLFSGDGARPRRRPRRRRATRLRGLRGRRRSPASPRSLPCCASGGRRSDASPCSTAPVALAVGECAVVAVVSAPHRDQAFEAARFAIDELKASAPIWKHETWADGADWGTAAQPISDRVGSAIVIWVILGAVVVVIGLVADRPRPSPQHRRRGDVPASHRRAVARGPAPGGQPGAAARRRGGRRVGGARRGGATRWPVTWPSTSEPPTRSCT